MHLNTSKYLSALKMNRMSYAIKVERLSLCTDGVAARMVLCGGYCATSLIKSLVYIDHACVGISNIILYFVVEFRVPWGDEIPVSGFRCQVGNKMYPSI